MMRRGSSGEVDLEDYLLTVCPLWMQFGRQYNTKFQLYFEKNLQIIAKHQTPIASIKKDEPLYFTPPSQLQHFKIQTDKNLNYQWSLYIKRVDIKQHNEEFVQGQQVDFKQQWAQFYNNKKRQFEISLHFSRIKCKFVFLLLIAPNKQQLLSMAQKYTNYTKTSVLTDGGPLSRQFTSLLSSKTGSERKKVEQRSILVQIDHEFAVEQDEYEDSPTIRTLNIKNLSPDNYYDKHGQERTNKQSKYSSSLDVEEEENPKLSNSDLQIGQEIEEKIHQSQTHFKVLNPKKKDYLMPPQSTRQPQQERNDQKSISMTSSQLLNSKGQVIVPIYKRKSFIAACLVLIFILGMLAFKSSPNTQKGKKGRKKSRKKK